MFVVLLSWIYPKAGARLAQKLFLTPTRVPRPLSEKEFFETSKKLSLKNGIAAFEWGDPQGPLVLLVHGWSGRGTQMGAFAAPLAPQGFRVVALDGPAHGDSQGETTNVGAYAQFLVDVQSQLGEVYAVVAHSFGVGAVVLAMHRGLAAKKLVLIAGPARYSRVVDNLFKQLPLSPRAQRYFLDDLQKKVGLPIADMNVAQLGKALAVQALVVHDEGDKEVLYRSAEEISEIWATAKLLKTQGLGHRRILRDPHVLSAVTDFIRS